ncbi:E3 ubiquitin-protein ligase PUB23 [Platanthera guangdongensis]|uniref:U-box domain-containing protein n=1 Tax=Platanthera guangdongensis TaxID=2320717 RepID=A0ABR2LPR6_9ASPA
MEPEVPSVFRCPISMELMENPVIISTGVTYDRRSIEKWLFNYKKTTCPTTMQTLSSFDLIPNHTLHSLILSWRSQRRPALSTPQSLELTSIISAMESSPFKVSSLKKLRSFAPHNHAIFISCGGVGALHRILTADASDFTAFRACEEALGVLNSIPFETDSASMELLSEPGSVKTVLTVLQRGGSEARLHAITILRKISRAKPSLADELHHCADVFKSLLDLLCDEVSGKLSSSSLDLLLDAVARSKTNRLKAIEAGAVRVLIELLPEAGRHRGERTLLLLKRLCECAEGRSAFADHGLGIAAVASRMVRECNEETKLGVKVLWFVCSFLPTKKVVEDMMSCGALRKLLGLIHADGTSSAKEKALMMVRMHGEAWRQSPCFPVELRAVQY